MSSRLEEKERRREDRILRERSAAGFPPRKPPGTRNALGDPSGFPSFNWIEKNFSRMFIFSMVLSAILTLAIIGVLVSIIVHLL